MLIEKMASLSVERYARRIHKRCPQRIRARAAAGASWCVNYDNPSRVVLQAASSILSDRRQMHCVDAHGQSAVERVSQDDTELVPHTRDSHGRDDCLCLCATIPIAARQSATDSQVGATRQRIGPAWELRRKARLRTLVVMFRPSVRSSAKNWSITAVQARCPRTSA